MNGFETRGDLLMLSVLIWVCSGLITAVVAYAWARRPFDIRHFGGYLVFGPVVLVAIVVLSVGYWIISPWAESRTFY